MSIADPGQQPLLIGCLMKQANHSQPSPVRWSALSHLNLLGRTGIPALKVFREAAVETRAVADRYSIRRKGQLALLDLGPDAAPALPEVETLLAIPPDEKARRESRWMSNGYREEKVLALRIAVAIGPKAKRLLPLLRAMAKDEKENPIVRKKAEEAAAALAPSGSDPFLGMEAIPCSTTLTKEFRDTPR
ncbi:MAG: hypothetical protein K2W96_21275 [Gemmataceae bacterium]|nr:hypothetical protein [Gemmataceae bacterium]